jgi:hypothetical protein
MDRGTLEAFQRRVIEIARHFGDRCNSDSTLTAREATEVVKACLNAGNALETMIRDKFGSAPATT